MHIIKLKIKKSSPLILVCKVGLSALFFPALADNSVNDFIYFQVGSPSFETNSISNDAAEFAHYDYVMGLNRFLYDDLGDGNTTTWEEIHAYNPKTHISLYQLGPGSRQDFNTHATVYLNGIRRWDNSRGHPYGKIWPDYSPSSEDNIFLMDQDEQLIEQWVSYTGAKDYWLDFGSSKFQAYWLEATKNDLFTKTHDWTDPELAPAPLGSIRPWKAQGVFVDLAVAMPPINWSNSNITSKYETASQWQAAMLDFTTTVTADIRSTNSDQQVFFNTGDTRRVNGPAYWRAVDALPEELRPDGLLEEGAFVVKWGSGDAQFFPESDWRRQVDVLKNTNHYNVFYSSHTDLTEHNPNGLDSQGRAVNFWDVVWYSMGSYLLGKNEVEGNSYLTIYREEDFSFLEEMNLDIGKALGDYTLDTSVGVNVYSREFVNAWVYVNPTQNNALNIQLPHTGKPVNHDNFLNPLEAVVSTDYINLNSNRSAIVIKDVVVGDWQLNQSGNDIVDNNGNHHGIAYGDPIFLSDGIIDGALAFDGSDDYIVIENNNAALNTGSTMTIMAWIKPEQSSKPLIMTQASYKQNGWQLLAGPEYNGLAFVAHREGEIARYNSNGQYLNDGQWHHVAITIENRIGGAIEFYVDGELKSSQSMDWAFKQSINDDLLIGAYAPGADWQSYWKGEVDSITLWRKIASVDEIKLHYQGQVSHWPLDAPKYAKKAVDIINNMHANLYGDPQWSQNSASISFDGEDDYLAIEEQSKRLNISNKLTLTAWVKPEENSQPVVIERGQYRNNGWQLLAGPNYNDFAFITHRNGELKRYNSNGIFLNDTQWHHIAVTVDNKIGGELKFYVDGQLKSTQSLHWPFDGKDIETLYLGGSQPTLDWGTHWKGNLKKVKLFKRVLDSTEVYGDFNQ